MRGYLFGAASAAGFAVMLSSPVTAQQLNPEDQLAPSQMNQPMPGAVATPGGAPNRAPAKHAATGAAPAAAAPSPAAAVRSNAAIAASRVVVCSGPFSKDSSNLKLAMVFDSRNGF